MRSAPAALNSPRRARDAIQRRLQSRTALLLCLTLGLAALLPASLARHAAAQPAAADAASYDIPAGTLDQVLNRFAASAGILLAIDGSLTAGKTSPGLSGRYGVRDGLAAILAGQGLTVAAQPNGGYALRPLSSASTGADAANGVATLAPLTVTATAPDSYQPTVPVSSATRSPIRLLDLPQTVDIVPAASLRDRGATTLKEALAYTPGVTTSTGEGIREQFVIRGFSAIADTYVDGMRDGGNTFRDTFNIEQVEVVKGPAGVVYGRGSAGGLINLVTKRPTSDPFATVDATVGTEDARRVAVDLNQPLGDKVLLRVNAVADTADSFRSDVWSEQRGVALASTFLLTPAATLDLRAQHLSDERVFDAGIPGLNGSPADVPISTYYGARDPGSNDSGTSRDTAFSADLNVALTEALRLRNTASYRSLDLDRRQTTINRLILTTPTPTLSLARSNFSSEQGDFANKLELTASTEWLGIGHELMVGTEFAAERRDTVSRGGTLPAAFNIEVFDPVLKDVPAEGAAIRRDGVYDTETRSLYVQDLVRFDEHWLALGGIRKDWLERDFRNRDGADYGRDDSFLSPRAGVVYQPTPDRSFYVSATRSYQPGGATGAIDPGNAIQPAEISTNYEIGSKFTFNGGRLMVGASLFRLIKENVPTRNPSDPAGEMLYIGEITAEGLELTSAGDLGGGFSVQGGITWLDAKVTRSNNTTAPAITPAVAATPLEGKHAANAPRFSATVWGVQELDDGWRLGLGVRHQSETYASTTNAVTLPSYTVVDAGLFYDLEPLSLALTARNLLDTTYYESSTNDLGILPGEPRTVMFSARYTF